MTLSPSENSPVPNHHRGEVHVKIGGEDIILIPSFKNLVSIERETGLGLIEMASLMQNNQLHLDAVVAVLSCCCEPKRDNKHIEVLLEKAGLLKAYEAVAYLFAAAITAGSDNEGEGNKKKPGKSPKPKARKRVK